MVVVGPSPTFGRFIEILLDLDAASWWLPDLVGSSLFKIVVATFRKLLQVLYGS